MSSDVTGNAPAEGWSRLWAAVKPVEPHPVDAPTLGEYATILVNRGPLVAGLAFPGVALHLATGCRNCANDLAELRQVAYEELLDRLRGVEVAVRGGRFSPAGALRGRVGEEAAETVDVAAAYDDFRKGIVDGDRAARDAVETRYREIVAHWIRRDRSTRRPEADVDDLTRQTFARFWTRWSSEPFDQLSDISEVLRQLRRTTQDVLRDELRRRRDAENAPS